jgi:uncharacterized membrane protein
MEGIGQSCEAALSPLAELGGAARAARLPNWPSGRTRAASGARGAATRLTDPGGAARRSRIPGTVRTEVGLAMTDTAERDAPPPSPLPGIRRLALGDLGHALRAGLRDFARAPAFGLFFSAVYVLGGFLMLQLGAGTVTWTLATSLGFPLVAPFAAAGLYEVSRRLERGEPLGWRPVLGVVWAERNRQLPWLGAIIVFYFLVWTFLAHMIFALFMGLSTITNVSQSWDVFLSGPGLRMVIAEVVVGGILAFLLFAMTVVSMPLLLDREVDFVSAILLSIATVRANPVILGLWAGLIAAATLVALLPWFLGLLVVMPVFGHATWHLYRRALADPA